MPVHDAPDHAAPLDTDDAAPVAAPACQDGAGAPVAGMLPRPVPPEPPGLNDCCRSGCNPCVFDLYDDALARHEIKLAAWEAIQGRLE
jgi:hypothetical protein